MQKIGMSFVLMLAMVSAAFAAPGFEVEKTAVVTGDWAWMDDKWQQGTYPTAYYSMDAKSHCGKEGYYMETEIMGQPWKYQLTSIVGAEKSGKVKTEFHALTVNDPRTTPATGGFTKYRFEQSNFGEFSSSSLSVTGQGKVDVSTAFRARGEFQTVTSIGVNE